LNNLRQFSHPQLNSYHLRRCPEWIFRPVEGETNIKDPTDSSEPKLRRRDVLKRGATATSALIVGGTAVTGAAAKRNKRTGGMTAITLEFQYQPGNPFKVLNPVNELEFPASCHASESDLSVASTVTV
jgi:hypothetical protein